MSKFNRAIVIGGSISGLLAARVLAERFDSVLVVDKDFFPSNPEPRRGVPQSVQPHTLLVKGYRILTNLFPDLEKCLVENGAVLVDWVNDFFYHSTFGWSANIYNDYPNSDIISVSCSRYLIEWAIRQQVERWKNIQFLCSQKVRGLIGDRNIIRGVKLENQELNADLIVDASGKSCQSSKWLSSLGIALPPETVVNSFLGYSTGIFKPSQTPKFKILSITPNPPKQKRSGYAARIENDKLIITLAGANKEFPPHDNLENFTSFAKNLDKDIIFDVINQSELISPLTAYRATANRFRHFERISMPQGFITVGDAACSLCPLYGQGIAVSAITANILRQELKKNNFSSRKFQIKLSQKLNYPWQFATIQDMRLIENMPNKESQLSIIFNKYVDKLVAVSQTSKDSELHKLLVEVGSNLKSPLSLLHPKFVLQSLNL